MTELNREQTIKDLQEIVDNYSGNWKRFNVLDNALALIKELVEENARCVVLIGEEGDLQLRDLPEELPGHPDPKGDKGECGLFKQCQVDTVRKMRDMLSERIDRTINVFDFQISECNAIRQALRGVKNDINQIAKELLEEKNDV